MEKAYQIKPPFPFQDEALLEWWKKMQTSIFRQFGYQVDYNRWLNPSDSEDRARVKEQMSRDALERGMKEKVGEHWQPDLKPILQDWLQNTIENRVQNMSLEDRGRISTSEIEAVSKIEITRAKVQATSPGGLSYAKCPQIAHQKG